MAVVQGKKERSNFYVVKHFLFRREVAEGAGLTCHGGESDGVLRTLTLP